MGVLGWLRAFWAKDAIPPAPADMLGAATLPYVTMPAVKETAANLSVESPHVMAAADTKAMQARGYRNKNPGNIDLNARNGWLGQVGLEPPPLNGGKARFAVFEEHEYGIRALARLLQSYQVNHGIKTIAGIINRWAPPNENITSSYVAFVARMVGVKPDDPVDVMKYAIARPMVEAIIRKELGGCPYPPSVIDEGLKRAGVQA